MKSKTIFAILLFILPLALSPVNSQASTIGSGTVSVGDYKINLAENPHGTYSGIVMDQLRNARQQFRVNSPDYEIIKNTPTFITQTIDLEQTIKELSTTVSRPYRQYQSDEDFEGYPGNGTEDDPYIVSNLEVNYPNGNVVVINNTRVYVTFMNNYVSGGFSSFANFLITNSSNLSFVNNYVQANAYGFLIENSSNLNFERNTISSNGFGVSTNDVRNLRFYNNLFSTNNYGAFIENVETLFFSYNNVTSYNSIGLILSNGQGGVESSLSIDSNKFNYGGNAEGSSTAILVSETTGAILKYNHVSDNFGDGITLEYSSQCLLYQNTVFQNSGDGIFFIDSSDNTIQENAVFSNGYYVPPGDFTVDSVIDGVHMKFANHLFSIDDENHLELNVGGFGAGIFLDPSLNNELIGNKIYDNTGLGVFLDLSNKTSIVGNQVFGNGMSGVFFRDSNDNSITNNTIYSNGITGTQALLTHSIATRDPGLLVQVGGFGAGIFLDPSFGNTIDGNKVYDNLAGGLFLDLSADTTINNNEFSYNGLAGITFLDADENTVTNNHLVNNGYAFDQQASKTRTAGIELDSVQDPLTLKLMVGGFGAGIFLDPSFGNTIDGNQISGNLGDGVFFEYSEENSVTNNIIGKNGEEGIFFFDSPGNSITSNFITSNGFSSQKTVTANAVDLGEQDIRTMVGGFGAGIFLDPSPDNEISGNIVTDNAAAGVYLLETNNTLVYDNDMAGNAVYGLFLQDASHNNVSYNSIDNNGANLDTVGLSLNVGGFGAGIFLDPSFYNVIDHNNITGNTEGIAVEGSAFTEITNNNVSNSSLYGVSMDTGSSSNTVTKNNFRNNNGETSQGYDNGTGNNFDYNFWSDADLTDANGDGIADNPYWLDGDAGSADNTPSIMVFTDQQFDNPYIDVDPDSLNLKDRGRWIEIKVYLSSGYTVQSIDLENLWLNGTLNPEKYRMINSTAFKLKFDRSDVVDLIKALDIDEDKYYVTLELTGTLNNGDLEISATDTIKVIEHHDRHHKKRGRWAVFWFWCWFYIRKFFFVGGLVLLVPASKKFELPQKFSNMIN